MIEDSLHLEDEASLACDLCIIGAGPAGIALARKAASPSCRVILLESGGLEVEEDLQVLNKGFSSPLNLKGMEEGRARALGGAGRLWAGQCLPFDDIDFAQRPWVAHSGWPIDAAQLQPFVDEAKRFFCVEEDVFDARNYGLFGLQAPPWQADRLKAMFTVYTPDVDVGKTHFAALKADANVTVLLHATATEIRTDETGTVTSGVAVKTWSGKSLTINAPVVALCAGGLENARLLLLSRSVNPKGLGNEHDLVGRFFQDHPNGITATLTSDGAHLQDRFRLLYRRDKRYFPKFALSETLQRERQVLNANAHLVFDYPSESGMASLQEIVRGIRAQRLPDRMRAHIWRLLRDFPDVAAAAWRRLQGQSPRAKPSAVHLQCYLEQEPSAQNRVQLDETRRDRLGVPMVKVTWDVGTLERETLTTITQTAIDEFHRLGLGDFKMADWLTAPGDAWKAQLSDCNHHAGTTKMARDARDGVVDTDGQVFGVKGLYACGGSTFPTSGYANPTLVIVALALRLGDHLRQRHEETGVRAVA
ncbi:hypothetical protein BJF93_10105 [Xaviernesmea oryzae]|uniref:Glucose-methanol-choline oxidoreductase C-terminal domain-containing protein n=1 Tax=Xaviernesmea oryzae TaxID=464029 RepID=A0A1Q9AWX6_9HYPH|nr:GMC family oxidoreductase [Xaviernesmea oryzae]OLP59939.1 hypothetical protein BJF93_10105 [Xaviernesmea oryzae]SEK44020.1 Choline dehydrogenase [Xaviernesmea oryzae]